MIWCANKVRLGYRLRQVALAFPAAGLLGISGAHAAAILFDFNASPALINHTSAPDPSSDNSSQIASYMNGLLHDTQHNGNAAWNVNVLGAESSGAPSTASTGAAQRAINAGWNADNHVVADYARSVANGPSYIPATLATEYNVPFIETSGGFTMNGDRAIRMTFTGGITINSLSFNFEIFPDGTTEQPPDFTFIMTSGASTIENCTVYGLRPNSSTLTSSGLCGSDGTYSGGVSTVTAGPNANLYSLATSYPSREASAQYLGIMSFTFANPIANPTLNFLDWPDTIAVTNINLGLPSGNTGNQQGVPEPGSLVLLGSALAGLAWLRRRGHAGINLALSH